MGIQENDYIDQQDVLLTGLFGATFDRTEKKTTYTSEHLKKCKRHRKKARRIDCDKGAVAPGEIKEHFTLGKLEATITMKPAMCRRH